MKQTCGELLADFERKGTKIWAEKILFGGVNDKDVYNITAPFVDRNEWVIAGRVEKRDSEHSQVMFFTQRDGIWLPRENSRVFELQDPFITRIKGELVFGGVETFPHPTRKGKLGWRTRFYRGADIASLEAFATGPDGMKDIRLVELSNGQIGVFTRPQGEIGGRGKIGFTILSRLDDLNQQAIDGAELLDQFVDDEWGGANEIHRLQNGLLGVLGHIACYDDAGNRHYYPMVFSFDPNERKASPMKLIAARKHLPPGEAKRPDLVDVIFSGGLVRQMDGTAVLYAGVSDVEAYRATIPDPFLEYEAGT